LEQDWRELDGPARPVTKLRLVRPETDGQS
ncbi:MAG: hypothetical protein QOF96_1680, partial [Actinomycetota bacterium]|nr:hypothetical protein [Actinomycetota bacterium]